MCQEDEGYTVAFYIHGLSACQQAHPGCTEELTVIHIHCYCWPPTSIKAQFTDFRRIFTHTHKLFLYRETIKKKSKKKNVLKFPRVNSALEHFPLYYLWHQKEIFTVKGPFSSWHALPAVNFKGSLPLWFTWSLEHCEHSWNDWSGCLIQSAIVVK